MSNQPNRGKLKYLWDLLKPNQGYDRAEVIKIANNHGLDNPTAYNLIKDPKKYVIHNQDDGKYYRSDSNLENLEKEKIFDNYSTKEANSNVNSEKPISEVIREIKNKLNLKKNQKEQISLQKREIEEKEKVVEEEILKLENTLTVLQKHL